MIGITSFGGYLPRLRLDRMSIYQEMGWFAPATILVAQGERSFCNWDEDSLTMAVAASRDCLKGVDKSSIDGLYLCSTTLPFADRQNAGIVKGALNLRDDIVTNDFTSCQKAGTSALITAADVVRAGDRKQILVAAADRRETRAAGFYEMWFGDGAASLMVGDQNVIAELVGSFSISHDFSGHYRGGDHRFDYTWEERWVRDEGYSKIIPEAVQGLFEKLKISMSDVDKFVFPCFFKAEHSKIAKRLQAAAETVQDTMHEACGECGVAHPLVMFVSALQEAKPGDRILLVGFGQGADAMYFKVTDHIKELAPRDGVRGSLERKKTVTKYSKFLQFRNLIQTETGIRAEAPTQTAMSTLWRHRKMLEGLVGGLCKKCNTPQFPKMDLCVNPECHAVHSQEDYEFADRAATVKTFTGDYLAFSVDPPAIYGMIEFAEGGRFLADFTDCELDDVFVGQPVNLTFRKRYTDEQRGFSGYFWKAIPQPGKKPVKPKGKEIRLDGQVAVVTGAGGGLGRAYALELARRGAKVVVNDLGKSRDGTGEASGRPADLVVEEIKGLGGEAVANYDSVATREGGQSLIDSAINAFGRVDILINNAGILRDRTMAKMSPGDWEQVLAVHLHGAFFVTQPALLKMREQGYGRIVLTSSASGLYGNFGQTNYGAAKMGLVGLMNTLKLEGEKYNIRVNTVAPMALTRMTEDLLPPDLAERLKPEFVAPLVVYLSSPDCEQTGMIFNAGAGYYNRAAVVTGTGKVIGDGQSIPAPEDIHKNFEAINELAGAKEYRDAMVSMTPMISALDPGAAKPPEEAQELTVKSIFDRMPAAFRADRAGGVDLVFQYSISGPKGGDWFVVVKDETCKVSEGRHDTPTTTIKMSDADFLDMITGKLNAMQAYTTGKLKIEGDLMKSQLIEKLFKL